ncbi:DUF6950 family protein [Rhodobacter maris]|uniref:DUF6950 domain-containing protein n=1 Tax=Rhodobacter maris TaxID=446682 RepID=A0A285TIA8_9RHOB|nr:hypothetical protein [Rhodobacter maris]SOC22009.1 hypothetical protein SAMN05877831_12615 [Rhodobacter maris]
MVQGVTRRADWRARLHAEIEAHRREGFAWGRRDCALGLAAGAVLAMTGEDLAAAWRGRYRSASGAARVLRAAGFDSLGDAVAAVLPEIHPSQAHVGDIAFLDEGEIGALGIVNGGTLIVLGLDGIGPRERAAAVRAFKVG